MPESIRVNASSRGITLAQHIYRQQKLARATGEFSAVLAQLELAGKIISRALSRAGLIDSFGPDGLGLAESSLQNDMESFARETFRRAFRGAPWVSTLVIGDCAETIGPADAHPGKYMVFVNPLDGASNMNIQGSMGSIFSVIKRLDSGEKIAPRELLQRGSEQVAAGYIIYGPSTVMVYTSGNGVNMYTLDRGLGEFLISREGVHIPERGLTYSCNEAHFHDWNEYTRRYIDFLRQRDPKSEKHYSSWYAGALIAGFHRTLLEGGVLLCPGNQNDPEGFKEKLPLLHACNPLSLIAEQAGGRATNGTERILRIQPTALQQHSALVIGSPYEVLLYEDFINSKR